MKLMHSMKKNKFFFVVVGWGWGGVVSDMNTLYLTISIENISSFHLYIHIK